MGDIAGKLSPWPGQRHRFGNADQTHGRRQVTDLLPLRPGDVGGPQRNGSPGPPKRRAPGTTWELKPDGDNPAEGTTDVDYAGSQPLANSQLGLTVQYWGHEQDGFSIPPADLGASSGTWTVKAISGQVIATTTVGGQSKTAPLPFETGVAFSGTWTCQGDDMTATYAGVGEVVSLAGPATMCPRHRLSA